MKPLLQGLRKTIPFIFIFLLFIISSIQINAQVSDIVSSVKTGTSTEGMPLIISADLYQGATVESAVIFYRAFGQSEFVKRDMEIMGSSASVTIPAEEVVAPYLDYYLLFTTNNGVQQSYPIGAPDAASPLRIEIKAVSPKDKEVVILSPAPGETLSQSDLFISISLIKASANVNVSATKVLVDGNDITSKAVFAGDLILFYGDNFPEDVKIGQHSLTVELYDTTGALYNTISSQFRTVSEEYIAAAGERFRYQGNIRGESRNENYDKNSTWYNNIGVNLDGYYSDWHVKGNVYVTSEEKKYLQPMNRYSVTAENKWLSLSAGDVYPRYPNLILDGKRVRGFNGKLQLGIFNLQTSFGQVTRGIEGQFLQGYQSNSSDLLDASIIKVDSAKYGAPYGRVLFGTFNRDLLAIRPSFGKGENFQLGFSYLHAKDDVGSIDLGSKPTENLVFGTDLMLAFDHKNVLFTSQAAVSATNSDISTGSLTDAQIDSVFGPGSYFNSDPDKIKKIKNIIGNFITVNQFLGPLNPQELASLAAESALNLSYFNNSFKVSYIYRGNDFQSFGQTYVRTDVKGINLTDRIRMMENQVFLSLGYENLNDNLQNTKVATTTYQTINTTLSYFPRMDFPNITLSYSRFDNSNDLSSTGKDSLNTVDNATNRFFAQLSYDVAAFMIKHTAAVSFSTSSRDDKAYSNIDASNSSFSLSVNSFWTSNFTSSFGLVVYNSKIANTKFDYSSFSIGGRYKMLENKLELSANISPSFGDFERQTIEILGRYNVMQNLSFDVQLRYYKIPDVGNNSVVGIASRLAI